MEEECGSTSPTSADVAEQKGITSDEPPADEPLALVKKKIKIEPGLEAEEKDENKHVSMSQKVSVAQTSSFPLFTTGANVVPQTLIYTTNGVTPTVPQLVDLIPTAVNGKTVRPFKAYNANRELLGGLAASSGITNYPAVPIALSGPPGAAVPLSVPTVVVTTGSLAAIQTSLTNSNGGPTAHLMTLATEADKLLQKTKDPKSLNGHDKVENGSADEAMTPGSTSGGSDSGSAGDLLEETIEKIKKRAGLVTAVEQKKLVPIAPAPAPSNSSKKSKKSRNPHPDQMKDEHYWERRRKNNEAAKRSRDARRAKEDQIAIRAALLEQENMRLRIEVAALKEETVKLRAMLYNKK